MKEIIENIKVKEPNLSAKSKAGMWRRIEQNTIRKNNGIKLRIVSIAASVAIVLGAAYFLFLTDKTDELDYQIMMAGTEEIMKSDHIQLILSDEKAITIDAANVDLSYKEDGGLEINSQKTETVATDMNRLVVPYGKTSVVTLSDGTKIWVNSGSQLVYPPIFNKKKREICVEGEIYLEVVSDQHVPFIVKTGKMEIDVYGTSFNVSAYSSDEEQSIVLVTGSIGVSVEKSKQERLTSNQRFSYNTLEGKSSIQQVDVNQYICWVDNYIYLRNEKLDQVFNKLERYYNIPLRYDSEIRTITVSGKLDLKNHISEVLDNISVTTPITYAINEISKEINVELKK